MGTLRSTIGPSHQVKSQKPSRCWWMGVYDEVVDLIVRPPRSDDYTATDLFPSYWEDAYGNSFSRSDFILRNDRGLPLQCSHWQPNGLAGNQGLEEIKSKQPCVVYLHGNSGCRADSGDIVPLLLSADFSVFAFDFSGSGKSGGEYISLGWYERDDLAAVVAYLRACPNTSSIGVWGRSMGAATALLHAARDPSLGALVLDSAFASLKQLAHELVDQHAGSWVPGFAVSAALSAIAGTIRDKVGFEIADLEPQEHVETSHIPALFGTGRDDDFIVPRYGCMHLLPPIHDCAQPHEDLTREVRR